MATHIVNRGVTYIALSSFAVYAALSVGGSCCEFCKLCSVSMTRRHVHHLPVLDNGENVGMISIGDVVKETIYEQRIMIEQLEHTISWEEAY